MLFPTLTFAVFFTLVYPLNWLLRNQPTAWRLALLSASYMFYAAWDARFVGLIVASSIGNAAAARGIAGAPHRARPILAIALAGNLVTLGLFKYYGFFADSLNQLLSSLGMPPAAPLLTIVLPVGISFFTFQALSYVIDVHRKVITPAPLLDVAVFLAFFPQLVAGPIVRASEFLPQLRARQPLRRGDVAQAGWLIAQGLFKKVVISSYVASAIVDPTFAAPGAHTQAEVLLGVYGYAVQIYADFSGYTDMAIGLALLLGFRFPANFERPYAAASLQDFWRRWHMTLSRWLRDYLYIPLGGSHKGRWRTYINLAITMVLGGLWHGAAFTFVAWGALHGIGLAAQRAWGEIRSRRVSPSGRRSSRDEHGVQSNSLPSALRQLAGTALTFHFVCAAWVLFRAESIGQAVDIFAHIATPTHVAPTLMSGALVATIAGVLLWQLVPEQPLRRIEASFGRLHPLAQGAALGAFASLVVALGPRGVAPFVYFQF